MSGFLRYSPARLITAMLAVSVATTVAFVPTSAAGAVGLVPTITTRVSNVAAMGTALGPIRQQPGAPTTTTTVSSTTTSTPVGLLGPTSDQVSQLAGTKVTRVSLPSGWQQVEPQQNVYDSGILTQLRNSLDSLRAQGFQVVLDLGLQYPPSWVFSLPGATRFVDQYGDVWHGSLSEDVPNAVFDPAVRAAEADYITHLAAALGPANLASVRVGGLLSGELRYPDDYYLGHPNLLWDYDSAAQAAAPYPGWTPGTGTQTQIQASLNYYFNSLTNYETWEMQTVAAAFPGVDQEVMLPGWGLRPGMVDDVVSSGMQNNTVAEVNGLVTSGLDWADQVKAIADSGVHGTIYTTWLDAPTQAATVQGEAPVDYLASLAAQYNLPLAGENTGGGGTSALNLVVQRAQSDHLSAVMYMSGGYVASGMAGVTISDLEAAASTLNP